MNDYKPIHIIEKAFTMLSEILEGSYVKYIRVKLLLNRIVANHTLRAMNLRRIICVSFGMLFREQHIMHSLLGQEQVSYGAK